MAACDICGAAATRTLPDTGQLFCPLCGLYIAGQEHARAAAARDLMETAVGALLDCGVSGPRVEALCRAFVDREPPPPVEPRAARPGDPRPWTAALEPLVGGEGS